MSRSQRWDQLVAWPLTGAAVVFLLAYAIPIAAPGVSPVVSDACNVLIWIIWALFVLDYAVRFLLAEHKWTFFRKNLLDLAIVAMPLLRPLRLLRLLTLLSLLKRTGGEQFRGKVMSFTIGATILLLIVGALAITDAERGVPGANINSFGEALWWALTTITTVGYGDLYPVTSTGRVVAAILMISGIALVGVVTATLASWLVQKVSEVAEDEAAATRDQVEALTQQISDLRAELAAQHHDADGYRARDSVSVING